MGVGVVERGECASHEEGRHIRYYGSRKIEFMGL
jgi:hypothetical protein